MDVENPTTNVHTANGRPLLREDDDLFGTTGTHVARLREEKAYDKRGRYVGTLVEDRLYYRVGDSLAIGEPYIPQVHGEFTLAAAAPVETMDEEPPLPY